MNMFLSHFGHRRGKFRDDIVDFDTYMFFALPTSLQFQNCHTVSEGTRNELLRSFDHQGRRDIDHRRAELFTNVLHPSVTDIV
jgi:hypothetical protein